MFQKNLALSLQSLLDENVNKYADYKEYKAFKIFPQVFIVRGGSVSVK